MIYTYAMTKTMVPFIRNVKTETPKKIQKKNTIYG